MRSATEIEQQVSAWIIHGEMDSFTEEMQAEMESWLNKDLRNRVAYLRIREAWRHTDCLRRVRPLDGNVDPELLKGSSLTFIPANTRYHNGYWRGYRRHFVAPTK
jgi:ferric-dicitrate binding protein FerR (iron transport regulator)